MFEPRLLLAPETSPFVRALLRSWRTEKPSLRARARARKLAAIAARETRPTLGA